MLDSLLDKAHDLVPRIAVVLLGAVAVVSIGVGIVNVDLPIATFFAFVVAALHLLAALLVWRRSQTVGGRWAAGCATYFLVLLLCLYDVPGGVYYFSRGDTDFVPPIVWAPLLTLAAPFGLLSLLMSPSEFDERYAPWGDGRS